MYIEEVIIDGFKSYATRTVLSGFDIHFNAITGLNGSGKSNILDSICFVLGISNLSQVRVGNLQELVYKQGQAGVTKASVTLVFNNSDKKSSPIGYENFDQVTIARQVVIGGKNKYIINGHTSQAAQVQNLFHSVQLNVNNPHFLIMQGRITKVLNMKPPEILGMIEEAAGTRMFETKKQNALKTIEKKQTKVMEINSILSDEITPTLERLRGERTHYLKWSANNSESERLERFCVAHSFSQAEESVKKSDSVALDMRKSVEQLRVEVAKLEADLKEKEDTSIELVNRREAQAQGAYKKTQKLEESISKELVQANSEWMNKKSSLNDEMKGLEALRESQLEGDAAQEAKSSEVKKCTNRIKNAEKLVEEKILVHKSLQNEYQNMCAGVSDKDNVDSLTLTDQMAGFTKMASDASAREKQSALKLDHLGTALKQAQRELKSAEKEVSKLRCDLNEANENVSVTQRTLGNLNFDPKTVAKIAQTKENEEKILADLLQRKENLSAQLAGRLAFEYSAPHQRFDHRKVKGLMAKLVSVKQAETATALEVVAGGKLFQVVVDDEITGKALLQNGKLRRRVTIIPLNKIYHRTLEDRQVARAAELARSLNGTAAPALELVGFQEEVRSAAEYVFGTAFVCDSLQTAKTVAFDRGVRARTVTLEGDSFEPHGTLTGGSKAQLGTILAKLHELSTIESKIVQVEEKLQELSNTLKKLEATGKEHAKNTQLLELATEKAEILSRQLSLSTASQLEDRIAELTNDISMLKVTIEEDRKIHDDSLRRYEELKAQENNFREQREKVLTVLMDKVNASKAEINSAKSVLKEEQQKLQVLELESQQLVADSMTLTDQIQSFTSSVSNAREEVGSLEEAVAAKQLAYEQAKAALSEVKSGLLALEDETKKVKKEIEQISKKLDGANIELKKAQHKFQKCGKDSESAEKFIAQMLKKHPWIVSERQFFGESGTDYDFKSCDTDAAHKRLKAIQAEQAILSKKINRKVTGMLEKAESEYKELIRKRQLIEEDKDKINRVITELDQKKNQALRNTWVKVNRDFGSIFSTLLPGTSAKLEPSEGCSALEGLEVKVAFGSVWKESLTELSGGQRSLLALSLILSLLLFKPAPMYILDEVDAALDLSHTQNIGSMLKTHFSHSQFIVVSLKEGMFNNANVIFTTKFVDGVSAVQRTALSSSCQQRHIKNAKPGMSDKNSHKRSKVGDENLS